jgi:hypothetical protein
MTSELRDETGWCGGRSTSGGNDRGLRESIPAPGVRRRWWPSSATIAEGERRTIRQSFQRGAARRSQVGRDRSFEAQNPGSRGGTVRSHYSPDYRLDQWSRLAALYPEGERAPPSSGRCQPGQRFRSPEIREVSCPTVKNSHAPATLIEPISVLRLSPQARAPKQALPRDPRGPT